MPYNLAPAGVAIQRFTPAIGTVAFIALNDLPAQLTPHRDRVPDAPVDALESRIE
ncbi:MAG: hypothetical protein MZU95_10480 [Desulfomicrobium escambiense]|nr:hypothetical protein [Desulfomicrobium escambiense]